MGKHLWYTAGTSVPTLTSWQKFRILVVNIRRTIPTVLVPSLTAYAIYWDYLNTQDTSVNNWRIKMGINPRNLQIRPGHGLVAGFFGTTLVLVLYALESIAILWNETE